VEDVPPARSARRVPISAQPEIILDEEDAPLPARLARERRERQRAEAIAAQRRFSREMVWPSTWAFTRTTLLTFFAALLVATIFSYWTPDDVLPDQFNEQLRVARITDVYQPLRDERTPLPTEARTP